MVEIIQKRKREKKKRTRRRFIITQSKYQMVEKKLEQSCLYICQFLFSLSLSVYSCLANSNHRMNWKHYLGFMTFLFFLYLTLIYRKFDRIHMVFIFYITTNGNVQGVDVKSISHKSLWVTKQKKEREEKERRCIESFFSFLFCLVEAIYLRMKKKLAEEHETFSY